MISLLNLKIFLHRTSLAAAALKMCFDLNYSKNRNRLWLTDRFRFNGPKKIPLVIPGSGFGPPAVQHLQLMACGRSGSGPNLTHRVRLSFFMCLSWPLFLYFRHLYIIQLADHFSPMLGFELGISGVGSDQFANCATTTARVKHSLGLVSVKAS